MGLEEGAGRQARPGRVRLTLLTSAATLLLASPAAAQDWQKRLAELAGGAPLAQPGAEALQLAQAAQSFSFDIAAQPLPQAIAALSAVTGLQVLYAEEQAFGRTAPAVTGTFTAEQALERLLQGSGLAYRFVRPDAVTLTAAAPSAGTGAATLAPVTVTGERVSRSIMDTATSVAVLDAEDLESRPGLESTNDVLARIPNVTTSGTTNLAPAVRGVDGTGPAQGADAFFAGTRPRLNIQIDGRPASYNEVVFGDVSLWDVEQIEVLRGPQSTLQGRNAMAGTVVVKTKDPTFEFETAAQAIGGNRDYGQLSAMLSGPLIADQVAFRLAADYSERDSFVDATPYPETDDPERFESTTLRAKLLVEPRGLEDLSALVTVNHTEHRGPQTETVFRPFDEHVSSYPAMNVFNPRSTSGIVETTWDMADGLAFETTLSATDLQVRRLGLPGDGNAEINGHEVVVEPRLRFESADGRLDGVAGAYLFRAAQDESILLTFISPDRGRFDDNTATEAVFAEATYAILDDVDLTAGARLEQENRRREGAVGVFSVDLDETNRMFLPKLGLAWHATDELTVGAMASKGYNGGGAGFTFDVPFRNFVFEEEEVWIYETYARAVLDGGRLSLTGNLFFSDYKNFQLSYDGNPDPNVWSVFIRNVDRVHTYGAELSATWMATPELELFGGIGLLQTEVKKDQQASIKGNELPQAPAFTMDVGAVYRHESGIELGADARLSDAYYSSIDNSPRGKTDPYVVVNAQAGYSFNENLRAFAFVTNLFDSADEVLLEPGATAADDVASILQPRTFGVGLQVNF